MEQSILQVTGQTYFQPVQSGLLQIDATAIIYFTLALMLAYWLNKILFQPLLKVIKQRERMISGRKRVAERLEDFAKQREEEYQKTIDDALKNSVNQVNSHVQTAESQAAQKLQQESELATANRQKASLRLRREIEQVRTDGADTVVQLAAILTKRLTNPGSTASSGPATAPAGGKGQPSTGGGSTPPGNISLPTGLNLLLTLGMAKLFFTLFPSGEGGWSGSTPSGLSPVMAQDAVGPFPWFDWGAHLANFLALAIFMGYVGYRHLRHGLVVHNRETIRDIEDAAQKRVQARESVRKAQEKLAVQLPKTEETIKTRTMNEIQAESIRVANQLDNQIAGLKAEQLKGLAQEEKILTEAALRDFSSSVVNTSEEMLRQGIAPEVHSLWVNMFIEGVKQNKVVNDTKRQAHDH